MKNVWYLDDGSYIGPKDKVFEVLRVTNTLGKDFGLILNEKKTTIINPYGIASGKFNRPPSLGDVEDLDASFAVEELDIPQNINISRDHGVVFLGVPIPVLHPELNVNKDAANEFMENFLLDKIHSVGKDIERIGQLQDAQLEYLLLSNCLALCKVNHLLRGILSAHKFEKVWQLLDSFMNEGLKNITGLKLDTISTKIL